MRIDSLDLGPLVAPASAEAQAVASEALPPLPRALQPIVAVLPQLSRYTVVSAVSLGLDVGVYWVLATFGWRPALAGATGYLLGLMLHFALSTRFVFDAEASGKSEARLFGEFAMSGIVGLVLTASVIAVMTEGLGTGVLAAKAAAVIISFFAVFFLRRSVVFATGPAEA